MSEATLRREGVVKVLSRLIYCRMKIENNTKTPEAHTLLSLSLRNLATFGLKIFENKLHQ